MFFFPLVHYYESPEVDDPSDVPNVNNNYVKEARLSSNVIQILIRSLHDNHKPS